MNNPLVSILTPTYNHAEYIADCIESALAQTYTNWEMIIIDDGSTDETYSIATEFASKDSRIHVFTQENKGIYKLAETYNFALSKSSGKYIAVLEGDDVWLSQKLELQIPQLEQKQDYILCWGEAYASSTDLKEKFYLISGKKYSKKIIENFPIMSALKVLLFVSHMSALTVVIRRDVLESIGGFISAEGLPTTDLPTWQELAFKGKFLYVDQPLGCWRTSKKQATKTYPVEMIKGVFYLALKRFNQNKLFFESQGITENVINKHFNGRIIINYHKSGKYHYYRNEIDDAKQQFKLCVKEQGLLKPLWKIRAVAWLVKCCLKNKIF